MLDIDLSGGAFSVRPGGGVLVFFKGLYKIALVVEAARQTDVHNRHIGVGEKHTGLIYAVFVYVLHGGFSRQL